ncbi:hypothetical protein WJX81_007012 [Elliptochloris bilobata]|uniref:Phosphoribulokinase/uridine kinase domain-containing protein n=1 Tax=Elliptochloris bilobata TaxID=381761 RepID=A0AAW1SKA6_9CHLO
MTLQSQSATCMEEVCELLADRLLCQAQRLPSGPDSSRRSIIAIAGVPGSGKSSIAAEVCRLLNAALGRPLAVVVPMDGFHYYRRELDAMPDPAAAHARRGAPWTFNAAAFVACLRAIRDQDEVLVPSFDHGAGDPVKGDIAVGPSHQLILVEGNYLLLDEEPWAEVRELANEAWFVDVPLDQAMARVALRQVAIGVPAHVAAQRVATNDRPNADLVALTRGNADLVVPASLPLRGRRKRDKIGT